MLPGRSTRKALEKIGEMEKGEKQIYSSPRSLVLLNPAIPGDLSLRTEEIAPENQINFLMEIPIINHNKIVIIDILETG